MFHTLHGTGTKIAAALILTLTPNFAFAQVGLPTAQQPGQADCGPTALGSVTRWLQQNGLPELKTRGGGTSIAEFRNQLAQDAKADRKGTWDYKLAQAFNKIVAGSSYKGTICAQLATGAALKDFGSMAGWLAEGCQQVVLLQHANGALNHFVGLNNLVGAGNNRTLQYMDPATGAMRQMALTKNNGRLEFVRNGNAGWVGGIIVICPKNKTKSTKVQAPNGTFFLRYEPFFPPTRKCKDLHIKVRDGDQSKYDVTGLPAGWKWKVHTVNGQRYLSMYQDGSPNFLASGQDIDVTYNGFCVFIRKNKSVNQTTTGTLAPGNGALPAEWGWTNGFASWTHPTAPENLRCSVASARAGGFDMLLDWDDHQELDVIGYDIYDMRTNEVVLSTQQSNAVIQQLEVDTLHQFVVHAIDVDGLVSDPSEPAMMHLDELNMQFVQPSGPLPVPYDLPMRSSFDGPDIVMQLPGVQQQGTLRIATSIGVPAQPLPDELGHYPHTFEVVCDAWLQQGPIGIDFRYDEGLIPGGESDLRMLAWFAGQWNEVTQGIDLDGDVIAGVIPHPTTIAIVGAPAVGMSVCGPAVPNSTGGTAEIVAAGSTHAADEWLTLTATNLPPNQFGFFVGSQTEVTTPNIGGGDGTLCIGGNIVRFAAQIAGSGAAGSFSVDIDISAMPTFPTVAITAGETWTFQAWFRDANPLATSNLTNAVRVTYD